MPFWVTNISVLKSELRKNPIWFAHITPQQAAAPCSGTSRSSIPNPVCRVNPTYAVSLAVSLFDRNPRTWVLYAWHDMYTRRHRIEWHSWCRVRPIWECACVSSSLRLESGIVGWVGWVGCVDGCVAEWMIKVSVDLAKLTVQMLVM